MDFRNMIAKLSLLGAEKHTVGTDCGHEIYVFTDDKYAYVIIPDDVTNVGFDIFMSRAVPDGVFESVSSKLCGFTNARRELIVMGGENLTTTKMLFAFVAAKAIYFKQFDSRRVVNMDNMFSGCETTENVIISDLDTSGVLSMKGMFSGFAAKSLAFEGFDTRNVRDMEGMFRACTIEGTLNLGGISRGAESMKQMFDDCCAGYITFGENFDTSHCGTMEGMFINCKADSIDLDGLDTSSVTDMSYMFSCCETNNDLDFKGFDTSKVGNMQYMFSESDIGDLDLNSFDVSNVSDMTEMFSDCYTGSIDLSSFRVSPNADITDIFSGLCPEATVTCSDTRLKSEIL